jgi:hypothetical protein
MKPFGAVVERASKGRVIWALWMDSVMREDTVSILSSLKLKD